MKYYNMKETTLPDLRRAKLFTPVTVCYLIITILLMLFSDFAAKIAPSIIISGDGIMDGKLWTPLTFTFFGGGRCCVLIFVWNTVVFYVLGSYVERQWKSLPFLLYLVVISVLCGITWVLLTSILGHSDAVLFGTQSLGYSLMVVFGLLRRDAYVMIPGGSMKMLHFMLGLLVISGLLCLAAPLYLISLSGALWGYLYMRVQKKIASRRAAPPHFSSKPRGDKFVDLD